MVLRWSQKPAVTGTSYDFELLVEAEENFAHP